MMSFEDLYIRLPFCFEADITTECWNFYRMAIVNAHQKYDEILIDQFNHLYMDKNKEIHYGLSLYKTNIHKAYSRVLHTKTIPLASFESEEAFINTTIEYLKMGLYPLIECDYNLLIKHLEGDDSPLFLHEILIYGVKNNNFIIPYLRKHQWYEVEIPIYLIAQSFWNRKKISNEREKEFLWRREYLSPYTLLCPLPPPLLNGYCYDFYHDICHILERSCFENQLLLTKNYYGKEFSGILAVYNGVLEMLNQILDGEFEVYEPDYSLANNLKRIYEYLNLFYKHICFFQNQSGIIIPANIYIGWKQLKQHVQRAYILSMKYHITYNKKILYSISDAICAAFNMHHTMLEQLRKCIEEEIVNGNF